MSPIQIDRLYTICQQFFDKPIISGCHAARPPVHHIMEHNTHFKTLCHLQRPTLICLYIQISLQFPLKNKKHKMLPSSSVNHIDFRRQPSSTAPGLLIITLFITTIILIDFYSRTVQYHTVVSST